MGHRGRMGDEGNGAVSSAAPSPQPEAALSPSDAAPVPAHDPPIYQHQTHPCTGSSPVQPLLFLWSLVFPPLLIAETRPGLPRLLLPLWIPITTPGPFPRPIRSSRHKLRVSALGWSGSDPCNPAVPTAKPTPRGSDPKASNEPPSPGRDGAAGARAAAADAAPRPPAAHKQTAPKLLVLMVVFFF